MNTATTGALWREAAGALPNTLAIGYATGAYAMSFLLMAAERAWLNAIGVALCAHAMVITAYLIHEAAHCTLFAGPAHNRTLNLFDAFHHTFDQYFTNADATLPMGGRDRAFEQANTYSNVVSARWPLLNLLTLNFGYHNAHHERAAVPWYRLPALHAQLYGDSHRELMPLSQLLRTYHRNRLRRILDDDYGEVRGTGAHRADGFIGAHGVSFLSVV